MFFIIVLTSGIVIYKTFTKEFIHAEFAMKTITEMGKSHRLM